MKNKAKKLQLEASFAGMKRLKASGLPVLTTT